MNNEPHGLLVDLTRCIGCRSCVGACMEAHGFEGDPFQTEELSARAYTVIQEKHEEKHDVFVRRLCMHCNTPSCASVCPVGALRKTEAGPVTYDASRCLGCRYCIQACPFGVPRYQWDRAVPAVAKCDLCADRLAAGEPTICTGACPVEATISGPRSELIAEAHRRIDADPSAYYPHVYGEHEVGGTSVLFVSPVSFASLGFPQNLGEAPLPMLTEAALKRVPGIVIVGGALLMATWWITRRRQEVARAEAGPALPSAGTEPAEPEEGERHVAR